MKERKDSVPIIVTCIAAMFTSDSLPSGTVRCMRTALSKDNHEPRSPTAKRHANYDLGTTLVRGRTTSNSFICSVTFFLTV